ncbi:cytochrome P450 [Panus rudis PR-1116 ss-1]|nr:cytochrome P450 [Panus rudis PR-1116 ss-1]
MSAPTSFPTSLPSATHALLASPIITPSSVALAVFVFCLGVAVYRLYFSPLAAVPGPWYAAVSDLWISTQVLRLEQCRVVQSLFDKYGPIVRIGPNKIAFCDVTTMRSVYSIHKFDKSTVYKSLLTNNNEHAMTTLPHAEHAIRRKAYSPHYTPSNLTLFQPECHHFTLKLTQVLERISGKTSVECIQLFRHLMVDVLSATMFGSRCGALDAWAMNAHHPLTNGIHDFPLRGILRSVTPTSLWKLVCRIPNARWRQICDADSIIAQFVGERLYDVRDKLQTGELSDDSEVDKMPLMLRLLRHRLVSTNELMADDQVISECMGHMIAGSDTTSTLLSYLFWELSRRSDVASKLQAELNEAMPDGDCIPDVSTLNQLPYLNAFLKEGFRLHGSAPALLERVVPSRSAAPMTKSDEDFDMMGYALPPGTIVATQAWSMHRDPAVFPSPETFLPERWLSIDGSEGEEERISRMMQHLMPFGTGSRVCGGQNFAKMMLKIVLATVVRNFDVSANIAETNERTMKIMDAFVTTPAAKECKLSFNPRRQ